MGKRLQVHGLFLVLGHVEPEDRFADVRLAFDDGEQAFFHLVGREHGEIFAKLPQLFLQQILEAQG